MCLASEAESGLLFTTCLFGKLPFFHCIILICMIGKTTTDQTHFLSIINIDACIQSFLFNLIIITKCELLNLFFCYSCRSLQQLGTKVKGEPTFFMIHPLVKKVLLYVLDVHQGKSLLMILRQNLSSTILMLCLYLEISLVVNVSEKRL